MKIGLSIFNGIDIKKQVECFKKYGIRRTFVCSEISEFDTAMRLFKENGIVCETLHAPFNKINDMWGEDEEAARQMLDRLKDSVDKCAKHNIPVTIVHVSSGRPMPEICRRGIERYEELFKYAKDKGVKVALENLRYLENLSFMLEKFKDTGFCWDCGHENCYTPGIRYMQQFGNRLLALHIHDNRCLTDKDDHLLPFDGNIDFSLVTKDIADSGYEGTLMLEIGKLVSTDGQMVYEALSEEEFVEHAAISAAKLAGMVEENKKAKL